MYMYVCGGLTRMIVIYMKTERNMFLQVCGILNHRVEHGVLKFHSFVTLMLKVVHLEIKVSLR